MREIKFRGKNIKTNEWVYGGYYKHLKRTPCPIGDSIKDNDYEHLIMNSGFSDWNMPKPLDCFIVDEKTVGQYTGLKDKHGKEICAGDILAPDNTCRGSSRYIVEWNDKHCCFTSIEGGIDNFIGDIDEEIQYSLLSNMKLNVCEIIGNIHDNPELI